MKHREDHNLEEWIIELDAGTADSAFRVDNLWCLFFNRRTLEPWRMIFRINMATCAVESQILRLGDHGLARKRLKKRHHRLSTLKALSAVPASSSIIHSSRL